jgi:sporulation protein YlmC with PRC-barrel domain
MGLRLSKLYGMDIYTDDAGYIGKVNDVILNLEKGEIVRLTTETLKAVTKEEAEKVLREKSVLYRNVRSAKDILIVSRKGGVVQEGEAEAEVEVAAERKGALHSLAKRR